MTVVTEQVRIDTLLPVDIDRLLDEIVDVRTAAEMLGISRAAVVHAVQLDRIRGKKVGRSWALVRQSVLDYEVTQVRVEAGKAARRDSEE